MSAGQPKVEIPGTSAAHRGGPVLALPRSTPAHAEGKRVSVKHVPPAHSPRNEPTEAVSKALVDAALRRASRRLARARRLRLSGEKILAAAAARNGNVYPIDCKPTRRQETRHAAF